MANRKEDFPSLVPDLVGVSWRRKFFGLVGLIAVLLFAVAFYAMARFLPNEPVDYPSAPDHFKYGSTGGEQEMGFPYWVWQALPQVCSEYLPGAGYASLGLTYEEGTDLPIGVSKRRHLGIDRVFLNCAVCHASTVRQSPSAKPAVVLGMPAQTFDIMAFERFFFDCGASGKFTQENIIPEIERQAGKLSFIDKRMVYPLAIWIMRERLLTLRSRFAWVYTQHPWGPGRVDTFNSSKVHFNYPVGNLPEQELNAPADFPSIWNQGRKQGMHLHWDGNNTKTEERNKNAAFGTGTTPPTIDRERIAIVEAWLRAEAQPPDFKKFFPIDEAKAGKGKPLYEEYCAGCHGKDGKEFAPPQGIGTPECLKPGERGDENAYGPQMGKITRVEDVGTDPRRLDSFTYDLVNNLSTLYAGYDWRFCHFRKTYGYANMPLDGLWLRAPYLHNGSVPTLRDLLEPSGQRPAIFYRGNDVYDPVKVGFVSEQSEVNGRKLFKFDAALAGNGNHGHEGKVYGTELGPEEKNALVEYLKTF
jgi:hypothetical protein